LGNLANISFDVSNRRDKKEMKKKTPSLNNFRVHSHFATPYQGAFFFTFIALSSRFLKIALLGGGVHWQNGGARVVV
jgi:hypothetical protein